MSNVSGVTAPQCRGSLIISVLKSLKRKKDETWQWINKFEQRCCMQRREPEKPPHHALDESSYITAAGVGRWCTCVGANSQSPRKTEKERWRRGENEVLKSLTNLWILNNACKSLPKIITEWKQLFVEQMLSYTGKGFEFSVWMTSNLSKGFSSTRANRERINFLNTRKHCEQASLKVKLLAD